ncbi:radical SAM protein [Sphaerisporangium aureirubrum]|uniref:Radical SAM protein n=1 Tax=Sphaerisporangium aureirubrum TaxID=1544736 RepID=A0ABW1NPG3_9ACTN
MNRGRHRGVEARPRVLRGEHGWWFLGPGGVARLKDGHLTPDLTLRPAAERSLRERGLFDLPAYRTYSLTVLTSTNCNLGCAYCFQNVEQDTSGANRPPRIGYSRLTSGTITSVLEFAARRMAEGGMSGLGVMLFGGEPLLNPRGCRELLARAADYGLCWASMTSNGTLLTPALARQLSDLGLRDVQVTFDGDRDEHDAIRVRRTGGGTFDDIVRNMAAVTEATPLRWGLRVNVSHHNHEGIDDLVERLGAALDPSRCAIYFARVGDVGIGYGNDLEFSGDMAASFIRWQRRALELGFSVPRPRTIDPCQACSYADGKYGAVVNADGTLSSCWETAGKPGYQVGTVRDGYLPRERTEGKWISCEEFYEYAEDLSALTRFQDTVDAALLDYLSATGRLGK